MKNISWFVLALSLGLMGCSEKVTIEEKDGVIIVRNPKSPVAVSGEPRALSLEEDLRIGVLEGEDEYMFGFLRSVQVDEDENIYIADAEFIKIRIYDRDGTHIRSFGRQGQGPGEIGWPSRMYLRADNRIAIVDSRNRRFAYYSTEGECLEEFSLAKHGSVIRAWPDSRGFIYGDIYDYSGGQRKSRLVKYDPDFEEEVAVLAEFEDQMVLGEINPILYRILCFVRTDDTIVWAKNQEYCLNILSPSGEIVRTIYKEYDPIHISDAEKKRIEEERYSDGFTGSLKLVFPESYPPLYYLICDDQGKIYVRTYIQNEKGWLKWEVFDKEGRYILDFFHPAEDILFYIKNDKLYSMNQDNEEGIPHIRRYKMTWDM